MLYNTIYPRNEFKPKDISTLKQFLDYLSLRKLCDSAPGILLEWHVWIKFAVEHFPNQNKLSQWDEPILNIFIIALSMDIYNCEQLIP